MTTCNYTKSNITCQRWSAQTPHEPWYLKEENHNYCRNPDDDIKGPWCYTMNPDKRWEYCNCPSQVETTTFSPTTMETTLSSTDSRLGYPTAATNGSGELEEQTSSREKTPISTMSYWYLYMIGAVLVILLIIFVLLMTIKRKRDKSSNSNPGNESTTISHYEDVEGETLQRTRENTYTEIPFFAGFLSGYENSSQPDLPTKEETQFNGSASNNAAVYENERQDTYEFSADVAVAKHQIESHSQKPPPYDDYRHLQNQSSFEDGQRKGFQQNLEREKFESSVDNVDCTVYGVPRVLPNAGYDEEGNYETPCYVKNGNPSNRPPPLKNISPPAPTAVEVNPAMVCISPKLIDNEFQYGAENEADVYSTPASPVFAMKTCDGDNQDHESSNGCTPEEVSEVNPDIGKEEYCTMDNIPEPPRRNSEKVVTLSRTYVTMQSAKTPKSLKEIKRQLKSYGQKRKTK